MQIKENIKKIKEDLPAGISLVAATKTRGIEEVREAIEGGIEIIGENYLQEAEKKYSLLKGKAKFHCIGHLQKNKVKKAVEIFDMIQTVDSIETAEEISRRCGEIGKVMPVLIEINSGEEPNKDGVMPDKAESLVKEASKLKNIRIMGLMTMAPYFENPEDDRPYFKLTKKLFEKIKLLKIPGAKMEYISMGMSDSYKVAAEEGANMVRIGTKIFGRRAR
ncbi:YggS family pyridoxal phosphate-dependent enzyme [Candidatus Woesearchaeota archaeon]|nr:YggS family pyridoxal phosphate-dependent enzyme [Candidatus Woesearchaeota archaeon]